MKTDTKKNKNLVIYILIGILIVVFIITIGLIIKNYEKAKPVATEEKKEEKSKEEKIIPVKDTLSDKNKIDNVIFGNITFSVDNSSEEYTIRDFAIKNNIQFSHYNVYNIDNYDTDELIIKQDERDVYYIFKTIIDQTYCYKLNNVIMYDKGRYYDMESKAYYEIVSVTTDGIVTNNIAYEKDGEFYLNNEVTTKKEYNSYIKKNFNSFGMKKYPYSYS